MSLGERRARGVLCLRPSPSQSILLRISLLLPGAPCHYLPSQHSPPERAVEAGERRFRKMTRLRGRYT